MIRHFEEVHAFFEARFRTGIDPARKPRVLLFRNPRDYERHPDARGLARKIGIGLARMPAAELP